jgi:hypothetical protein
VSVTASAGGFNAKTINMNNIAYYPDLGINGLWEIIELDPAPAPPSCFTGDTEVLLADATTRPIEEIGVGELVVGRDGRISRVVAIERPLLGDRPLYSLDGGTPFVTGEHPFLTPAGWAAIEPSATAAENPQLHVAQLGAGDTLLRVLHARALAPVGGPIERVELEMAEQPLDRVRAVRRAPDVTVHNLLLDGDHTYLANGYVVHNKNGSH